MIPSDLLFHITSCLWHTQFVSMLWVASQQSNAELQQARGSACFSLTRPLRHVHSVWTIGPTGATEIEVTDTPGGCWRWTWPHPSSSKPWRRLLKAPAENYRSLCSPRKFLGGKEKTKCYWDTKSRPLWSTWELSWREKRKAKHKNMAQRVRES